MKAMFANLNLDEATSSKSGSSPPPTTRNGSWADEMATTARVAGCRRFDDGGGDGYEDGDGDGDGDGNGDGVGPIMGVEDFNAPFLAGVLLEGNGALGFEVSVEQMGGWGVGGGGDDGRGAGR